MIHTQLCSVQIRPLDYRKGHGYFSFFLFSFCSTSGKEETEFQITHRWYNFHFSSPTAEARPPSAHPAPQPSEVKAGPGRARERRPGASPGGARKPSCGLPGREDKAQLRAPRSLRSTWRRSRRGRRRCKLGPHAPGQELCSPESPDQTPRAREGASAQMPLGHRQEASTGRAAGARKTKNFRQDVPAAFAVRSQIHRPAPAERRAARATVDGRTDRSVRPRRA